MSSPPPPRPFSRAAAQTVRLLLATLGSYGLAVAFSYAAARLLPMSRNEAATTAQIASILVVLIGVIISYAADTAGRAAAWIIGLTLFCALLAHLAGPPA